MKTEQQIFMKLLQVLNEPFISKILSQQNFEGGETLLV